ncbi:MAG: flagellar protein FlaG [Halieaceae bacterium]|nr:flagellar protein FlaG [Halieaceae bacterium]
MSATELGAVSSSYTPQRSEVASPAVKSTAAPVVSVQTSTKTREVNDKITMAKSLSMEELAKVKTELEEAVKRLADAIEQTPTATKITVDKELDRFIVQVTDKQTGEVVREIPGEAILKIARNIENLKGLLYDNKA